MVRFGLKIGGRARYNAQYFKEFGRPFKIITGTVKDINKDGVVEFHRDCCDTVKNLHYSWLEVQGIAEKSIDRCKVCESPERRIEGRRKGD